MFDPVATAPGSVFVDPRLNTALLPSVTPDDTAAFLCRPRDPWYRREYLIPGPRDLGSKKKPLERLTRFKRRVNFCGCIRARTVLNLGLSCGSNAEARSGRATMVHPGASHEGAFH